jgi:60 kDa SS-A/Ro ribonucleoprotein
VANKNLFGRAKPVVPVTNTRNRAGGVAYSRDKESELAQYVVTGCLNGTYYASAKEQLDTVLGLAHKCSSDFLARCAAYGHKTARMKDTPALLLAVLLTREDVESKDLLRKTFNVVCTNAKMVRNFVQVVRSGVTGRKNLGSTGQRLIQKWLRNRTATALFKDSIGNSPSLADVVKMVHPRPENTEKEAFYSWLLGKEKHSLATLPPLLRHYEDYKAGRTTVVPEVNFQMLASLPLGKKEWTEIARNASWNTARMNLNTFLRHDVFDNETVVREVANKLSNGDLVRKNNVFPYQLLTTYQNTEGKVPAKLSLALQQALEIATENVPDFGGKRVAVLVDTSGSMSSAVTGNRGTATSVTTCVDVAGLIAASVLRKNPETVVVPFDTCVHDVTLNPMDSVMTNAKKLARNGGGTNCACALEHLNAKNWKGDLVIYVSDNESWYKPASAALGYRSTGVATEWAKFKKRNPNAKMVCIDIQPNSTVQQPDNKYVLNVGGFTDSVFSVIANFVSGDADHFSDVIKNFALDTKEEVVYNNDMTSEEESDK